MSFGWGSHSLTLHTGKARSCFKVQLKYHFARKVLSSPYRLNEPLFPWVSMILYLSERFHQDTLKTVYLNYLIALYLVIIFSQIFIACLSPNLDCEFLHGKKSSNFVPYQRTWPTGKECLMTEFATNMQSRRWWAQSDKDIQKRWSLNFPGENQKQSHRRPKFWRQSGIVTKMWTLKTECLGLNPRSNTSSYVIYCKLLSLSGFHFPHLQSDTINIAY